LLSFLVLVTHQTMRRRRSGRAAAHADAARTLERERKLFRLVMENAPGGLAVLDRQMRYIAVSRRWMMDYGLSDDPVGKSHYEVFPEIPEEWRRVHRRALAGEVISADEDRFMRADGSVQWVSWRVMPWYDVDGSVGGIIITAEEVTDQVSQRKALQAMRFAEQFIGVLGHDLRNPLNAIQMAASLLRRKTQEGSDDRTLLDRIITSATRMNEMVTQLLDLTRAKLGAGIPLERQAVDLSRLVADAVEELRLSHPRRAIHFEGAADMLGKWDPGRLTQAISNLIGNALQHGDPARAIGIKLSTLDDTVVLDVQNFGAPIPPEVLPFIFDPYRQGGAPKGRAQGLGLGLFIARQIALAHAGRIDVRSNAQEGTIFTMTLPRLAPERATPGEERAPT
jgi:PAS domain S-box-containing protein